MTLVSAMPRALRTRRFLVLLDQLAAELGSYAKAEKRLGIATGYASKLRREEHRDVGARVIAEARRRLHLRDGFFTDPSLGDSPNYRNHVGGVDPVIDFEDRAPWLELVADGYVDYAREEGVSEEEIQHLRRTPEGRGGLAKEDYRRLLDEAIARARRSLYFKSNMIEERELPQSKEARERRRRKGKRAGKLPAPDGGDG